MEESGVRKLLAIVDIVLISFWVNKSVINVNEEAIVMMMMKRELLVRS